MFSDVNDLVAGSDGSVWVTQDSNNHVDHITPSGEVSIFNILPSGVGSTWNLSSPSGSGVPLTAFALASGRNGSVWLLPTSSDLSAEEIRPDGTALVDHPLSLKVPTFGQGTEMVEASDGAIWFTTIRGQIARYDVGRSGALAVLPFSRGATRVAAGSEGDLWFVEFSGLAGIGHISPTGDVKEFPFDPLRDIGSLVLGPDGNIWFTSDNMIGRMTPGGAITQFPMLEKGTTPQAITVGPDGNLWFTIASDSRLASVTPPVSSSPFRAGQSLIGRITPTGVVTEFPLATNEFNLIRIVTASDGAIWFTERWTGAVGRLEIAQLPILTGSSLQGTASVPTTGAIASFTIADHGLASTDFSATIDWGDGSTSTGTISGNDHAGYDVLGTHSYAQAGSYRALVKLSADNGDGAMAAGQVTVTPAPPAPSAPPASSPAPSVIDARTSMNAILDAIALFESNLLRQSVLRRAHRTPAHHAAQKTRDAAHRRVHHPLGLTTSVGRARVAMKLDRERTLSHSSGSNSRLLL